MARSAAGELGGGVGGGQAPTRCVDTFPPRAYTVQVFGAVAQLGERRAGSAEVRGSIPLGSTPYAIIFSRFMLEHEAPRFIQCLLCFLLYESGQDHPRSMTR